MGGIKSVLGAAHFALDACTWLAKYVPLHASPPSNKTIGRVLSLLDTAILESLLLAVAERQMNTLTVRNSNSLLRHFAADGKAVSGSVSKHESRASKAEGGRSQLMTANIIDVGTGLTIASAGTAEEADSSGRAPSEQALVEDLLKALDLMRAEVSVDAGHARRRAIEIVDAKAQAYWTMCIKGNNEASRILIQQAFNAHQERKIHTDEEIVLSRGDRRIVRLIRVQPRFESDQNLRKLWPKVKSMIIIERQRTNRGSIARHAQADREPKKTTTISYYLSSVDHTAISAARTIRRHWHVENTLHWMLDVNYGEDASQVRERALARNLAILRRVAKNLLRQAGEAKGGVRDQRRFAFNDEFRNKIFPK